MFVAIGRLLLLMVLPLGVIAGLTLLLSPRDNLQQADVIVAISGGDTEARTKQAITLYKQEWAPRLIFSGAALDPLSPSNAAVMSRIASLEGVPPEDVELDERAINTSQNARQSKSIIEQRGYKKIILVTSAYHQRRAFFEFKHKLGDHVEVLNYPAEDRNWHRLWWWVTPHGWTLTISETVKIPLTLLKNAVSDSTTAVSQSL